MDWKTKYKDKITTATEAVGHIADGCHIVCSHAAANPQVLMRELVAQRERFTGVKIFHVLPLGYTDYMLPENARHFRHVTTFAGAASRGAVNARTADFIPAFFKDVPAMMGHQIGVDVALLNVSPPDEEGYCSFGVSCDYSCAAVNNAKLIIAQINESMPRVGGRNNTVHISHFDHIVPTDDPLPEVMAPPISAAESEIGRLCASLVEDGDTLQLGIGAIPDAVLGFLGDKRGLGLHSEMISDRAMDMMRAGVIDGSRKSYHAGKAVVSFLFGSRALYDFVADNPAMEMMPVNYVNNPAVIAQNDQMVSINSCIEVDLSGQVNSESIGPRHFSGLGGQVDFVRGAQMSRGGRSIIAMPSTAAGGTISRIVMNLTPGAVVTTSRGDVDHIVTEWGIAALKGLTLDQRAEALIAIAHPDFRKDLREAYDRHFVG